MLFLLHVKLIFDSEGVYIYVQDIVHISGDHQQPYLARANTNIPTDREQIKQMPILPKIPKKKILGKVGQYSGQGRHSNMYPHTVRAIVVYSGQLSNIFTTS